VIQRHELPNSLRSSPIVPWTLVASTTLSRRPPASAFPTIFSDSPRESQDFGAREGGVDGSLVAVGVVALGEMVGHGFLGPVRVVVVGERGVAVLSPSPWP
jgi:hypothetical protein